MGDHFVQDCGVSVEQLDFYAQKFAVHEELAIQMKAQEWQDKLTGKVANLHDDDDLDAWRVKKESDMRWISLF